MTPKPGKASGEELGWCLVRLSGPLAGTRYPLPEGNTRVGRAAENDLVIDGPESAFVSGQHAEIRVGDGLCRLSDRASTNGTFVDGCQVTETELPAECVIQFGASGPEYKLTRAPAERPSPGLNQTLAAESDPPADAPAPSASLAEHDAAVRQAVETVRRLRGGHVTGQTVGIMRDVVRRALNRTRRRSRRAIVALLVLLVTVSAYGGWQIYRLRSSKDVIDAQIRQIEQTLDRMAEDSPEAADLAASLERYQAQGRALQQSVFYKLGVWEKQEFLRREIHVLLSEFGAEVYSVPPEFVEQVHRYVQRYQAGDRPHMERALGAARPALDRMRKTLTAAKLPPDLAYMVLAESGFQADSRSHMGSAGLWQFTADTARAYGLKVGGSVDERYNAVRATQAAARMMHELILEFGAGSSVMLAMAAYNSGPARVRSAIRKRVDDPIRQRNFWYLYRVRALPAETREYVPKVIAAMIIGRNPQRFGF